MKLIDKDVLVAEIEKLKADALQKKSQCKRSGLERIMHQIGAYNKIISFLDTLEVKEVDLENRTKILADIIFDAAKHGYMPYDTQDEYCAMEKARRNIIKLI